MHYEKVLKTRIKFILKNNTIKTFLQKLRQILFHWYNFKLSTVE